MDTLQTIAPFLLASAVIELTPGPNMAYLALLSSIKGRGAGFALVAGIATGLLLVGFAAAFGAAEFISGNTALYNAIRWAGVFYMIWLAYDSWREEPAAAEVTHRFYLQYFRNGLITNILNPKAILFYITVLPSFISAKYAILQQYLSLTVLYVCIATIVHSMIMLLGSRLTPLLSTSSRALLARRIFSVILLLIAIWLAWLTRRTS